MRFLLYLGCTAPTKQYGYELSLRSTLPLLGAELEYPKDMNCCGVPMKGISRFYPYYACARIMAIAESQGLDIVAPCNGCHLNLTETVYKLKLNPPLMDAVNALLKEEGLRYSGKAAIYHPVEVLHDKVGVERIASTIKRKLPGIPVSSHPGCHLLRPTEFPRPETRNGPLKLDRLIEAIGLKARDYPEKYECCGAAMLPYSPEAAIRVVALRIKRALAVGSRAITSLCPYCIDMLDGKQDAAKTITGDQSLSIPALYYTQLLGLALGLSERELGINLNMSPVEALLEEVMA